MRATIQESFIESGGKVFACGRDPYFPAWPDVLQLNAFQPGLRQAVIETVSEIAEQCDGIRCDMAMLVLNAIFERTWGGRAGSRPDNDYWTTVIPAIKGRHPAFRFIAEAYWDLEWELQQQGFDFCYDKKLYDRMEHGPAESVQQHLLADLSYQEGMVRFIENHDEPRAAATFPDGKSRAAAVVILTLPGARLLHEGQFEGRRVRLPVFLGRRPAEPVDHGLAAFYGRLLKATNRDVVTERRVAPVRVQRVARQPELPEHPRLVLGQRQRTRAHRRELRARARPGSCPGAMGRVESCAVAP